MESISSYGSSLGIDVCAERLDWYRLPDRSHCSCSNTAAGIRELIAALQASPVDIVVVEGVCMPNAVGCSVR